MSKGIMPIKSGKPGKVGVGGPQLTIMLHCQRGKVRVRYQVGSRISFMEEFLQDLPMLLTRLDEPYAGLFEPALHAFYRFSQGQRSLM